jgi:hypothetical protein|tara:strand:+ start:952 stop:1200 length:249 start_codon:yes stop_codon:yes gene_type:complete
MEQTEKIGTMYILGMMLEHIADGDRNPPFTKNVYGMAMEAFKEVLNLEDETLPEDDRTYHSMTLEYIKRIEGKLRVKGTFGL